MIDLERFWAKVDKNGPACKSGRAFGRCWIWTGASNPIYGKFTVDGKLRSAHVVAYELSGRKLRHENVVRHRCDTPLCVRFSHLVQGTTQQNVLESRSLFAEEARRTHCPFGHPLSGENVLTAEIARGKRGCRICHNARRRTEAYRRIRRLSRKK